MAGLEQVRDIFDRGSFGLVLIGMPGMEKRLARYAQFTPASASSMSFDHSPPRRSADCWTNTGRLPACGFPNIRWTRTQRQAIIRITGGNFRLLNRLLAQTERILEINAAKEVTKAVVEAPARAS